MLGLYKSLAFIGKQKKNQNEEGLPYSSLPYYRLACKKEKGRSRTKNRPGSEGCGKFRLFERELPRDHDPTVVG